MSIIKRFVKRITYNISIDVRLMLFCGVVIMAYFALEENAPATVFTYGVLVILILLFRIRSKIKHKNIHYFCCYHSIIKPRHVWINQSVSRRRNKSKCPQKEFVRDMIKICKSLPKGTECYCCTHELIVKHIKRKFPNAECTPVYRKDLKRLKKKIKSVQSEKCSDENCPLTKSEVEQFYAVKFTI